LSPDRAARGNSTASVDQPRLPGRQKRVGIDVVGPRRVGDVEGLGDEADGARQALGVGGAQTEPAHARGHHRLLGHHVEALELDVRLEQGIALAESIDIGIAVDTDAGLLVPVIRGVPALGLREVTKRSNEVIELARRGELPMRDMQGGCFTITNLGAYGIDTFTPIINSPECAILGVGRIVRQPVMEGERVIGKDMVTLSLTFDHRIVDGAPAARFLQTLAQLIENPAPWLVF